LQFVASVSQPAQNMQIVISNAQKIEDMENDFEFLIKVVKECTDQEIETFKNLILKGGKVKKIGLKQRILNCLYLGFVKYKNETVSISAIKIPSNTYKERVILKSKIDRQPGELNYEIGYSFTELDYRKRGLSSSLKKHLINNLLGAKIIVFCTTAIPSSQKFLVQNGFTNFGFPYDGENDKNIMYYERLFK